MVRPKSAVRKFAHKAYIPPKKNDAVERRAEPSGEQETSNPSLENVDRHPVTRIIDNVSYSNLHAHVNDEHPGTIKEMRLVLERYSPQAERPDNDLVIEQEQDVRPPPPTPRPSNTVRKPRQRIPKLRIVRDSISIAESLEVRTLKVIQLRNRQIIRPWKFDDELRKKQRARRGITKSTRSYRIRSTMSSDSVDDNRPLTYFINKNVKNQNIDRNVKNLNIDNNLKNQNIVENVEYQNIYEPSLNLPGPSGVKRLRSLSRSSLHIVSIKSRRTSCRTAENSQQSQTLNNNPETELSPETSGTIVNPRVPRVYDEDASNSSLHLLVPRKIVPHGKRPPRKPSNRNAIAKTNKKTAKTNNKNTATKGRRGRPPIAASRTRVAEETQFVPHCETSEQEWCGDSDMSEFEAQQNTTRKSNRAPTSNMPLIQEVFSLSDSVTMQTRKRTLIKEACTSSQYPSSVTSELMNLLPLQKTSDSLSEFVIDLFNFNEKSHCPDSDRGASSSSMVGISNDEPLDTNERNNEANKANASRFQAWLTDVVSRRQRRSSITNVFKIPDMPLWRLNHTPSEGSVKSVSQAPLPLTEVALRRACTAWNYDKLSNLQFDPTLIKGFCAECTRCKLMFKNVSGVPVRTSDGPSGSATDVYEFNEERDDNPGTNPIAPYRNARTDGTSNVITMHFKNRKMMISEDPEFFRKLKDNMTKLGKKMCHVAHLIKFKIMEGAEITPRNTILIAQVANTLVESSLPPKPAGNQQVSINSPSTRNIQSATRQDNKQKSTTPTKGKRLFKTKHLSPRIGSANETDQPRQTDNDSSRSGSLLDTVRNKQRTKPGILKESKSFTVTEANFVQSPVKFLSMLMQNYPHLGICGVKPPLSFQPDCKLEDLLTTYKASSQFIHRMLERFSGHTKEFLTIRSLQPNITQQSPLFAGLEVDLVKLFNTVQEENGIETVNSDMKNWDIIKQKMGLYYRGSVKTKLQNIYFKHLLAYNALTPDERIAKIAEMDACWKKRQMQAAQRSRDPLYRQKRMLDRSASDEEEPSRMELACAQAEDCCVTNGRSCTLRTFKQLAQQMLNTYFPDGQPTVEAVELQFWEIVMEASAHVCVHSASVDTTENGLGFPADRSKPYGDHPWNLKRLGVSSWNLLSYLGPTPGVSSTSLHYGMLFSASCWHMDPTKVPYVEFLHSGPSKIWYTISNSQNEKFRQAVEEICPHAVLNKTIWLPCDLMFIPPALLLEHGVEVSRHIQHVGEYVVIYPNTYCASISTGYTVSEGAYFAPHEWVNTAESVHLNLQNDCEPGLFSMHKLLIAIARDSNASLSLLQRAHSVLVGLLRSELSYRARLIKNSIELITPEGFQEQNMRNSWAAWQLQENGECAYCRTHTALSRVIGLTEGPTALCAMHGMHLYEQARKKSLTKNVYCILLMSNSDIEDLLYYLRQRVREATTSLISPR